MSNGENFDINSKPALEADELLDIPSEEEIQKIMAEVDKDSNTRRFTGVRKSIASWACIALSVFVILLNTVWRVSPQMHRASFVALMLLFSFIFYPARKQDTSRDNYVPWYDILLGLIGAAAFFYYVYNFRIIVGQMGRYTTVDFVVAVIGIIILFEACRRVVGMPLIVVVSLFLAYAYFGKYIPGDFGHAGYTPQRIFNFLFYTTEGIIGTPIAVCSTFIFIFVLFGSFLEKTGIGQFFIDLANSLAGRSVGGPAKVAVISSALQGTVSGSSVANTVGTGSFTIPMMKRMGYQPHFAGAVEAAASTGGQIMPPVMGAAAFLMSEITGLPYSRIILGAAIPAVLYFSSIFVAVHFEAKKIGLKGMPKEEVPHFGRLMLGKGHLLLAVFAIVFFLSSGFSTTRSALYAIVVAIVMSMFRKDTRMSVKSFLAALEDGAKNSISVAIACAMAGMIVGVVTMTGLGLTFAKALQNIAALISVEFIRLLVVLFFCMIASLVLGMGVPTTANYIIMATVTAPIVIRMGIPLLAAHMFVFYFGIIADITPPVALAAYAGASIAKSDPMKTGITASRLGIAAFIVPYVFALSPQILFINPSLVDVSRDIYYSTYPSVISMIQVSVSAFVGASAIAVALTGYINGKLSWLERLIISLAGLMLIIPENITDIVGISAVTIMFVQHSLRMGRGTRLES
ncbi:MAG: TRAP transporter fused permease subunit [Oscillospiraceae bacterium]|nr:TRAP transporter fused permease subunit [Oscillospiraceae bacterium]